jgi:hypothetical protein
MPVSGPPPMSTKDIAKLVAENLSLHAEIAELRARASLGHRVSQSFRAWMKTAYRACQRVFRPRLGR